MSADTMCGVVLSDVTEVFTHPFAQCSFSMTDVLFQTHLTSNTVDNIIGLATATSNGVVFATGDWTNDLTRSVQFQAISAISFLVDISFIVP